MWTSERSRRPRAEEAPAEVGEITLSQGTAGVNLGGERRWAALCCPGGYAWRPAAGDRVLVRIWKLQITDKGLNTAIFMAIRLIYLIIGSSLMTLTTTPNDLTDGLETLLGPLKKLHVPVHEVSMMMSIALRFIPILLEETDKIMKAQMARGADFEHGNLIQRAKSLVPLLVPLFISAFRRASDLAMAMEARCYRGGEGRTKMKPLAYARRDYCAYGILILFLAVIIALRVLL